MQRQWNPIVLYNVHIHTKG